MNATNEKRALACAVAAARAAGALIRRNRSVKKKINSRSRYDIKLDLDVRCQKLIETALLRAFPESGVLGEEGESSLAGQDLRWVVDPIDGTVNFTYGIPHACVSIALQERAHGAGEHRTIVGVVYDPFCDELFTATTREPARVNGKKIQVSARQTLDVAIVAIGFAKDTASLRENLPVFNELVPRVLKLRMMGSAALSLAYVASGRFDAYLENGISIWDIAAAGFILERAGGDFWRTPIPGHHKFKMLANNGHLREKVSQVVQQAHAKISN